MSTRDIVYALIFEECCAPEVLTVADLTTEGSTFSELSYKDFIDADCTVMLKPLFFKSPLVNKSIIATGIIREICAWEGDERMRNIALSIATPTNCSRLLYRLQNDMRVYAHVAKDELTFSNDSQGATFVSPHISYFAYMFMVLRPDTTFCPSTHYMMPTDDIVSFCKGEHVYSVCDISI